MDLLLRPARRTGFRLRPAAWSAGAVAVRLAALAAAAWTALLLARFGAVVATIYWNADAASALTIGELFPSVPGDAHVTLANFPWYATLWFELATRHLPFHRQVWEVGPWVGSLAAVGLVCWATARAAGRWAAGVVALLLVCAGHELLFIQFAPALHGTAVAYACVLDAFLVLLVARGGRIGPLGAHVVLAAAVAAVAAAGAASDLLVYPAALVPFAAAGLAVARLAPGPLARRVALTTAGVTAGAVAGGQAAAAAMRASGAGPAHLALGFTRWDRLVENALDAVQSLASLFNGGFDDQALGVWSALAFACGVTVAAALVAAIRFGVRWSRELAGRLRGGAGESAEPLLRTAHLAFWLLAAALPVAAFVCSSLAHVWAGRYLVSTAYGLAVVVAVAAAPAGAGRRAAVTFGAAVVALGSVVALARSFDPAPGDRMARELLSFLEGEGLTVGYASYWDAVPLTWRSRFRVQVYPVLTCRRAPHGLCTYPVHVISSWYRPRRGVRTFLVADHRYGPPDPGRTLGGTAEVVSFEHYSVYVYDYDIAANLADWRLYAGS
ncbi:MAG TPA: hypothetical protein VFB42_03070 [Gaiellaceae bacterium]|nr:hypothetical protein [Gaiellaceae bacterium]